MEDWIKLQSGKQEIWVRVAENPEHFNEFDFNLIDMFLIFLKDLRGRRKF